MGLLRVLRVLRVGLLRGRLLRLLRVPLLREAGEATAAGLRILRVLLRTGLLRLPFLAARTLAIIALAAAEPLAGRPLRRGEVLLRLLLESEVGESNLTILLMQIKKIIFFYFCSDFITFFLNFNKIITFFLNFNKIISFFLNFNKIISFFSFQQKPRK